VAQVKAADGKRAREIITRTIAALAKRKSAAAGRSKDLRYGKLLAMCSRQQAVSGAVAAEKKQANKLA
jgi:hypothetical protein